MNYTHIKQQCKETILEPCCVDEVNTSHAYSKWRPLSQSGAVKLLLLFVSMYIKLQLYCSPRSQQHGEASWLPPSGRAHSFAICHQNLAGLICASRHCSSSQRRVLLPVNGSVKNITPFTNIAKEVVYDNRVHYNVIHCHNGQLSLDKDNVAGCRLVLLLLLLPLYTVSHTHIEHILYYYNGHVSVSPLHYILKGTVSTLVTHLHLLHVTP